MVFQILAIVSPWVNIFLCVHAFSFSLLSIPYQTSSFIWNISIFRFKHELSCVCIKGVLDENFIEKVVTKVGQDQRG